MLNKIDLDLKKLNSATKYPSIPTYHPLDPKNGSLLDNPLKFEGEVLLTEKIDGTNARIIFLPDKGFILGSRTEFLYAKDDLIGSPAMGIVDALKDLAWEILVKNTTGLPLKDVISIFYFEVFGGKITPNSSQYTGEEKESYRLLDIAIIREYKTLFKKNIEQISSWRENGGLIFLDENNILDIIDTHQIKITPLIHSFNATELPLSLKNSLDFLEKTILHTNCLLDDTGEGKAEGLVLRTKNRSQIAKMKFRDYRRALKKK